MALLLASLQLAAVRVPPVLGGEDEGHGRREGPTREGEVSRSEGGGSVLDSVSAGSHCSANSNGIRAPISQYSNTLTDLSDLSAVNGSWAV